MRCVYVHLSHTWSCWQNYRSCTSGPHKNQQIVNCSKFIFTSYVFFHVWGLLVKHRDLFHLAPNLAEESLSSRAVPPGFMHNSASVLFWQIAAVPKYLFRLQSLCHSKGHPGISPHPPSICPTLFTQTQRRVALFIGFWKSSPTLTPPPPIHSLPCSNPFCTTGEQTCTPHSHPATATIPLLCPLTM